MDKMILGILMLQRFTVYEIRNIIKRNFKSMCSDSLGSIQSAIKKLLAAHMVTCREYIEKNVNKKQYSITDKGREMFLAWLNTPAAIFNPKTMELGKLLFMGIVPKENRLSLVEKSIDLLEAEHTELLSLKSTIEMAGNNKKQIISYWRNDPEYLSGIQNATHSLDIEENADDINDFQMLALQYGIDNAAFQIEWYQKLAKKLKCEN